MSIEAYADTIIYFYIGLFLLSIIVGIAAICLRIRRKTLKRRWIIPYVICYSVSALFGAFIAYMAYDDPADPNYGIYAGWGLLEFILNDIRRLIIWLAVGVLLYFVFERKECKTPIKAGRKTVLIFVTVLLALIMLILFTALDGQADMAILQPRSPSCGCRQIYDGSFSGRLIEGQGIFARMLEEAGIKLIDADLLDKSL